MPHAITCFKHKFGLNTFAVCRADQGDTSLSMTFTESFLRRDRRPGRRTSTRTQIETMATGLAAVRERGGRLFILGVGGSAGHASHAVNDFRKICELRGLRPHRQRLRAHGADQRRGLGHHLRRLAARLAARRRRRRPGLLGRRRRRGEERLDQHRARARAGQGARRDRSSASSVATAGTPPSCADACVVIPPLLRRPHHAAHRGALLRWSGTCSSPTRRWPATATKWESADVTRDRLRRVCVVGGAGFIGSHFVDALARRPGAPSGSPSTTTSPPAASGTSRRSRDDPRLDRRPRRRQRPRRRWPTAMAGPRQRHPPRLEPRHRRGGHRTRRSTSTRARCSPTTSSRRRGVAGVERVLYASGSGVYGDLGELEVAEDHGPLVPTSTYGASKLAGEALLASYAACSASPAGRSASATSSARARPTASASTSSAGCSTTRPACASSATASRASPTSTSTTSSTPCCSPAAGGHRRSTCSTSRPATTSR